MSESKNNPQKIDRSAVSAIFTNINVPLSNFISQLIRSRIPSSNPSNIISPEFLNSLSLISSFDPTINCVINKFASLLFINPEDCSEALFSNLIQVNLDANSKFSPFPLHSSHYLSRLDAEFPKSSILDRCVAFYVIDKLQSLVLLTFLQKIKEREYHLLITKIFTDFLFNSSSTDQNKDSVVIKNLNSNIWAKVFNIFSIKYPCETFFFFIESFSPPAEKTDSELSLLFNKFRSFDSVGLQLMDIDSLSSFDSFVIVTKKFFIKTSNLEEAHVSVSLFLMNFVANEIKYNRTNSKFMAFILNLVADSLSSAVSLPIAAVFLRFENLFKKKKIVTFTINQIITQALDCLSYVSGSSILVLHTFSQLLSISNNLNENNSKNGDNLFNDIYINEIKYIKKSPSSIIPEERIQKIFNRIVTFGSFNKSCNELVNFLVQFSSIDFPKFVESFFAPLKSSLFLKFNALPFFDFVRIILEEESIKKDHPKSFSIFHNEIKEVFKNYIKSNPPKKDSIIYAIPSLKECKFLHILEELEPKPLTPKNDNYSNGNNDIITVNPKTKNDVSIWSKILCSKRIKLFEEEKKSCFRNCGFQKENQPIALLFSLVPFLKENEELIRSIIPFTLSISPQISLISVYVIRNAITQRPDVLSDVLDILLQEKIDSKESYFNIILFLNIFIESALEKSQKDLKQFKLDIYKRIEWLVIIGLCFNRIEIRKLVFDLLKTLEINFPSFDDPYIFCKFIKKLKILIGASNCKVKASDFPMRTFREIALTNYEPVFSIYLSVIIDNDPSLKITDQSKIIETYNTLFEKKDKYEESALFYINIMTFLVLKHDSIDQKLLQSFADNFEKIEELNSIILCNFASSFIDMNIIVSSLSNKPSLFVKVARILWQRFPNDETIRILMPAIINLVREISINNEVINDNENVVYISNLLALLSKIFKYYSLKHEVTTNEPFLRKYMIKDFFLFFGFTDSKESDILFEFCLNSALFDISLPLKTEGKKAFEELCKVSAFYVQTLRCFDLIIKRFPKAMKYVVCQNPRFVENIINHFKYEIINSPEVEVKKSKVSHFELIDENNNNNNDNNGKEEIVSSFSILSFMFPQITSFYDSSAVLVNKINQNISSNSPEYDFSKVIYGLTGKILAICLWDFYIFNEDSINIMKNLALSFLFLKSIKQSNNELAISSFVEITLLLNSPTKDIEKISCLLCNSFEFCLDQFICESFTLLSFKFDYNFVRILRPWFEKIQLSFSSSSLSPKCFESCFHCLPSFNFVNKFCSLSLFGFLDSLIEKNSEHLFVFGIYQKESMLVEKLLKILPKKIPLFAKFFNYGFWRYQTVQLGKLGSKYFNEINTVFFNSLKSNNNFNSKSANVQNNNDILSKNNNNFNVDEIFECCDDFVKITDFALLDICPSFLNDINLVPHVLSFCISFEHRENVNHFRKKYLQRNEQEILKKIFNEKHHLNQDILLNEIFFQCLYDWATKCGDIKVSLNAASFLVDNYQKFNHKNGKRNEIDILVETITILVYSINSKNDSKSTKILGDNEFSLVPYYKYLSMLICLLSLICVNFQNENQCQIMFEEKGNVVSSAFWFICEFLVVADKDFGQIFQVVISSLYILVSKGFPDEKFISKSFEGILLKITKMNPFISRNCIPNSLLELFNLIKILFFKQCYSTLIGFNICEEINFQNFPKKETKEKENNFNETKIISKDIVSSISLFIIPILNISLENKSHDAPSSFLDEELFNENSFIENNNMEKLEAQISKSIFESFNLPDIHEKDVFYDHICNFLSSFDNNLLYPLLQWFYFLVRFSPCEISSVFGICSCLIKSPGILNLIKTNESCGDILKRIMNIALKDKNEVNTENICMFLEEFRKNDIEFSSNSEITQIRKFPHIELYHHFINEDEIDEEGNFSKNVKGKEDNDIVQNDQTVTHGETNDEENNYETNNEVGHWIIKKFKKRGNFPNLYFPIDINFLTLNFVDEIREKCSNSLTKIEPFTKWESKMFKAEMKKDNAYAGEVSCSIFEYDEKDIKSFLSMINEIMKIFNKENQKLSVSNEEGSDNDVYRCCDNSEYDLNACSTYGDRSFPSKDQNNNENDISSKGENMIIDDEKLFSVDQSLFLPNKEELEKFGSKKFPNIFL